MLGYVVLIIIMLFLSAIFSSSEIAFNLIDEFDISKVNRNKKNNVLFIKDNYDKSLISILIGNNLVNVASSSLATVIALNMFGDIGLPIATLVMTIIIIIFGEIMPKILANHYSIKICELCSEIIYLFYIITSPIITFTTRILNSFSSKWKDVNDEDVTEDDLETMIQTAENEDAIDEDTADLLQNAMDFDAIQAFEIITHRIDVEGIDIDDTYDSIKNKLISTRYSRLPVYKNSLDNVYGFVIVDECLKSMINNSFDLKKEIIKMPFIFKTTLLDDALNIMRKDKKHIAVVTDEYGGSMGIITMEDVLEQIFGEIWDESDVIDESIKKIRSNLYYVLGDVRIEDLCEKMNIDYNLFETTNTTIGGFVIEKIEKYPKKNDSFNFANMNFLVTKTKGKRIIELKVKILNEKK